MIRAVCCVDAGKRCVRACPHLERIARRMLMEEEKEHMTTVATPPITTARFLSRHQVAEGTMAFRFERPSNWTFRAGQYLDMTLLDPPETAAPAEYNRRWWFSAAELSVPRPLTRMFSIP